MIYILQRFLGPNVSFLFKYMTISRTCRDERRKEVRGGSEVMKEVEEKRRHGAH